MSQSVSLQGNELSDSCCWWYVSLRDTRLSSCIPHDIISSMSRTLVMSAVRRVGEIKNCAGYRPVKGFRIVCTCRQLTSLNLPTGMSKQSVCCPFFYVMSEFYFVFLGESLYNLCRGVDTRSLRPDQPRQSVSCDVNYGIRLTDQSQVENLFSNICKEVSRKLDNAKLVGKQVIPQNQCKSLSNNFRFVLSVNGSFIF